MRRPVIALMLLLVRLLTVAAVAAGLGGFAAQPQTGTAQSDRWCTFVLARKNAAAATPAPSPAHQLQVPDATHHAGAANVTNPMTATSAIAVPRLVIQCLMSMRTPVIRDRS
jgi:hypothetical protein